MIESHIRLVLAATMLVSMAATRPSLELTGTPPGEPSSAVPIDSAILKSYKWRSIGPDRGGRSIAATGVRGRPKEAYFGAVGGGLWKTTDGGSTWNSVTDDKIKSASVGAVAVSESNPDVVYI